MNSGWAHMNSQAQGFHVTVATSGGWEGETIGDALRLVRSALLYADEVTLISPAAAAVKAGSVVLEGTRNDRVRRLMRLSSALMQPEYRDLLEIYLATPRARRRSVRALAGFEERLRPNMLEVEGVIRRMREQSGVAELEEAERAGVLRIDSLGIAPEEFIQDSVVLAQRRVDVAEGRSPSGLLGDSTERAATAMLESLVRCVSPRSMTFPLFDEAATEVIRDLANGDHRTLSRLPAVESGLSSSFVGTLPTFPDASVMEILDVRKAARPSLIQFRGAVAGMALEVENAAWDATFEDEAQALFRANVAPELARLESDLHDMGATSLIRHAALSAAPYGATATVIGLSLAASDIFPDVAAATLTLGSPAAGFLGAGVAAMKERNRLSRERRTNHFVWLHDVDKQLARASRT